MCNDSKARLDAAVALRSSLRKCCFDQQCVLGTMEGIASPDEYPTFGAHIILSPARPHEKELCRSKENAPLCAVPIFLRARPCFSHCKGAIESLLDQQGCDCLPSLLRSRRQGRRSCSELPRVTVAARSSAQAHPPRAPKPRVCSSQSHIHVAIKAQQRSKAGAASSAREALKDTHSVSPCAPPLDNHSHF